MKAAALYLFLLFNNAIDAEHFQSIEEAGLPDAIRQVAVDLEFESAYYTSQGVVCLRKSKTTNAVLEIAGFESGERAAEEFAKFSDWEVSPSDGAIKTLPLPGKRAGGAAFKDGAYVVSLIGNLPEAKLFSGLDDLRKAVRLWKVDDMLALVQPRADDPVVMKEMTNILGERVIVPVRVKEEPQEELVDRDAILKEAALKFEELPKSLKALYEGFSPRMVEFVEYDNDPARASRELVEPNFKKLLIDGDKGLQIVIEFYRTADEAKVQLANRSRSNSGVTSINGWTHLGLGEGAYFSKRVNRYTLRFRQGQVYVSIAGEFDGAESIFERGHEIAKLIDDYGSQGLCELWKEGIPLEGH